MTDKSLKNLISYAVNIGIVGIVLVFTTLQAFKFILLGKYVHTAVFVVGALSLAIFFVFTVIDFCTKEAPDILDGVENKFVRYAATIAIAFVILLPSTYTLFLSDLIKIS